MLRSTIEPRCTSAYVALLVLLIIYILAFATVMDSQELPIVPWAAVRQKSRTHESRSRCANPTAQSSAALTGFVNAVISSSRTLWTLLEHVDWNINYDKSRKHLP